MKLNFKNINFKRIFLNRYFIATLVFAAIILFSKNDNLFELNKLNKHLKQLDKKIEHCDEEYQEDSAILYKLQYDKEFREKYAREHYYLKNSDEDVYIISDDDDE